MFTNENISKLENIYERIDTVKTRLSHEFSLALEASKDTEFEIERKGEKSNVTGATLWYEVQNLGADCDAGKILKPIYGEVFTQSEKYDELVKELNDFSKTELGIDPLQMTLLDIVRISKGIIENNKNENENK